MDIEDNGLGESPTAGQPRGRARHATPPGQPVAQVRGVLVERMVEKPARGSAPSNLAVIGRYLLPPDIFGILEQVKPGAGGEIQLTDALRTMAQQEKVLGLEFEGTYYDVGTVSGFLKTSIAFALERPGLRQELLT